MPLPIIAPDVNVIFLLAYTIPTCPTSMAFFVDSIMMSDVALRIVFFTNDPSIDPLLWIVILSPKIVM